MGKKSRLERIKVKNKLLKVSAIFLGIFVLGFLILLTFRISAFYKNIHTEEPVASENNQEKNKKEEKNEYTILLLGYGGGAHEGAYLTDSIMVAHVNLLTKKVIMISLPRDIWVKVPTKNDEDFYSKINAVYQIGMFPEKYPSVDKSLVSKDNPSGLIKKSVENITGLEVDGFVAIDFEGFKKAIDSLGGVKIDVKKSFTDYEYPIEENKDDLCGQDDMFSQIEPIINKEMTEEEQTKLFEEKPELKEFYENIKDRPAVAFPCRFEILSFQAGETLMDGETALKYARSRHAVGDGGDFNRAKRQQNLIDAVKKKVLGIGFIPKIIPLVDSLEGHVKTDLSINETNRLLLEGANANRYEISTLILDDKFLLDDYSTYGGYILVSKDGTNNWTSVREEVKNMRLGITPSPTEKPTTPTPSPNE